MEMATAMVLTSQTEKAMITILLYVKILILMKSNNKIFKPAKYKKESYIPLA